MSRYSQLYIERGRPTSDSERARIRLDTVLEQVTPSSALRHGVLRYIQSELGIKVSLTGGFFKSCEIRDLLDAITVIERKLADHLNPYSNPQLAQRWHQTAARILQEENLAYRIDAQGIVHPYPDAEFAINSASALAALDQAEFAEARGDFVEAMRHLRNGEGKQALRMMFPAVESAAKVLFPNKFAGLATNEVEKHIKPALEARYAGNEPAIRAGKLLLDGMKDWINAAHQYRHGQGEPEPADPPDDFVVAHLSAGATYLRWMIELCG
jgi:hypothetical protein